jgi:hypothetical protein
VTAASRGKAAREPTEGSRLHIILGSIVPVFFVIALGYLVSWTRDRAAAPDHDRRRAVKTAQTACGRGTSAHVPRYDLLREYMSAFRGFPREEVRMMMQAKNFSVVMVGLGVMLFALGGMVASAQTSAGASLVLVQQPPASESAPSILEYQVVTPKPGTGSVLIVQQPPALGSGPSGPQYLLVIPGPNPAQNTGVSLGQQLSTTRVSTVTVYTTPTL